MRFWKYHGLGNDYLVMHPDDLSQELTLAANPLNLSPALRHRFGWIADLACLRQKKRITLI